MRRTIDMVRSSSLSATLMQAAARGALAVPSAEMIEILVYLANHNKVFGQQARMTLAGWDEKASLGVAADPETPQDVLDYLIAPENLRPKLLPALLDNPRVPESTLIKMAAIGSREVVDAMRASERVKHSPAILHALAENPNSTQLETSTLGETATSLEASSPSVESEAQHSQEVPVQAAAPEDDAAVDAFLVEHARELALEGEKPFQPLGGIHEFEAAELESTPVIEEPAAEAAPVVATAATPPRAAAAPAVRKAPVVKKTQGGEAERGSALQKISKLDVKGRIQLAMKGTKEERAILIRDSTKLVALGVLESGKITDGEVEKFASQKNVLEAVLRQIPMKRRFMKNYNVVRNLVANPRTPLDVSLGLVKNLLVTDLRNLSSNKEVSDTIRKLALKMFKQKSDPTKKSQ